jgi:hypothetical protein
MHRVAAHVIANVWGSNVSLREKGDVFPKVAKSISRFWHPALLMKLTGNILAEYKG